VNTTYLDFAKCKCGYHTPIRPSKPVTPGEDQRWKETDNETLFVACNGCKRVYSIEAKELTPEPSTRGLSPFHESALLHVFPVPIECDDINCNTPLEVIAVRNIDTNTAALKEEMSHWRWADLKCPFGHEISWPQWH
jgi:hypothetical protein